MEMDTMHSYNTQFDLYRLPNEMWIAIFEAMAQPSELLKVVRTCKHFYALAIRVLYRHVQWLVPFHFASNIRFWFKQPTAMADVPTSLVVGISHIHSNSFARFDPTAAIVDIDGTWTITPPHPAAGHGNHHHLHLQNHGLVLPQLMDGITLANNSPPDIRRLSFFASKPMYDAMATIVSSFSMLQELIFHHADLPEVTYAMIRSLPRLRHLAIQYCSLPLMRREPDTTFSDLPITELTLWCSKADTDISPVSNYVYALHLCTARGLRVLKVDWTAVTARFFALQNPHAQVSFSPVLHDLALRMPVTKLWPAEGDATRTLLLTPLSIFLRRNDTLRRLAVFNRLPYIELPAGALPHLESYTGPLSSVVSILRGRSVAHLEIADTDKKMADFFHVLPEIARAGPALRSLCLTLREWDNEILFAVSQLFDDLRKIRIRYDEKYPSEYTLLSLGAQFLYRFPRLESVQLYQPSCPVSSSTYNDPAPGSVAEKATRFDGVDAFKDQGPGAAADDDVRELIVPWHKYCRALREVQFEEGAVWRRAYDGDVWCKRALGGFDKYRELVG